MTRIFSLLTGLFCVLALTACGPVGSPSANPDHGAPAPANGHIEKPARPKGMADNFVAFNWHVEVYDEHHRLHGGHAAIVRITATSPNAQVQGNIHGQYPFRLYTQTPYTHTIWYQPGIRIQTDLTATADPILPDGWYIECTGTSGGLLAMINDFSSDPMICISRMTIG